MGVAIRKHFKDFVAVLVLVGIAAAITLFILVNQNVNAPSWVPVLGHDTFQLKAEFQTAQAVTPGQGQTVNIAGVPVGQVSGVDLKSGRAVVTMDMDPKFKDRIYPNATMLLRPKTGLKDMIIALDPGSSASGAPLGEHATISISHTQPDVNFDEFLSVLDADTRDYLVLLLNGGGQGLVGNGRTLAQVLRRFDPTQRNIAKITSELQKRQTNIKKSITYTQLLLNALGSKDTQLSEFVKQSNASLAAFAAQETNIKQTINLLPGALSATNTAMKNLNTASQISGPVLNKLLPAANGLAAVEQASQPFFAQTLAPLRDQIKPFAIESLPALSLLKPTSQNLAAASPGLLKTAKSFNYGLNELTYEDPSVQAPPYLFNAFWLGHNTNAQILNQDAAGPVRQSVFLGARNTWGTIYSILKEVCAPAGNASVGSPSAWATIELLRAPRPTSVPAPVCRGS
jgi:phospholipid/cholesterol/gamma-HCH transport system substrate-binding protein